MDGVPATPSVVQAARPAAGVAVRELVECLHVCWRLGQCSGVGRFDPAWAVFASICLYVYVYIYIYILIL